MMDREDELTFQMEKASNSMGVVVAVLRDMAEYGDSATHGTIEGVRADEVLWGCINVLKSVRDELKAAMLGKRGE